MTINQVTNPASVWTVTPRTITGLDGSITTNLGVVSSTLASGTNAFFLAPAGSMEIITFVGGAGANVAWTPGLGNGTSARPGPAGTLGAAVMQICCSSSTMGLSVLNGGTGTGSYSTAIIQWNS